MRTSILKHSFSLLAFLFISISVIAQPTITSISPTSAKPGDAVTILGSGFPGTVALTDVYFGNAKVTTYQSASTGGVRVVVPVGATYGPILVFDKLNKKYRASKQFFSPTFTKPKGSFDGNDMTVSSMFSTNKNPYGVAVGDVDGDGKPDAVVVSYDSNKVSVLRNTSTIGNVNFDTKVDFATGVKPMAVALADMDNDGKLDIIVANSISNNVSVFKNTSTAAGTISFATRVNFATGTTGAVPNALAIADMNGDGLQDIVATNGGNNTIAYLENTSTTTIPTTISFATRVTFATGTLPQAVAIGDLDANGTLDVVVANNSANTISVLQNTTSLGAVSFATKVDYNVGTAPQSVAMGDIDADGKLDVVVSNYTTGSVSTLRNITGTVLTLNTAVNKTATPFTETVGITDIDADGKVDVVFANNASSFSVLRNTTTTTTPTYATSVDFTTGSLTKAHAMGDIDGDGKIDAVVITSYNDAIVVVRNTPNYSSNANLSAFIINTTAYTPILSTSVTNYTASVTNATTSVTVKATKAQDSATLQIQLNGGTYTALTSAVNSSALPLNLGENIINIKVTAQDGTTIKVYTFTVTRIAPPTITSISPMSGIVGTSVTLTGTFYSSTPANNVVFFGATQANVTAATTTSLTVTVPAGATYAPITVLNTVSDLSGAGKDYFNTTFKPNKGSIDTMDMTASANFGVNTYPGKTIIGDIDGDGKTDAVVLDNSSLKFSVLRNTSNTGAINFAPKVDFTTLSSPESITLGDINNDGKLDVIVVDFLTDSISIFRNTSTSGTISFAPRVNILCGLSIGVYTNCVVGDIDGDGKQDIVVTNIGQNQVSVLRNTSTSTTNISFAFFTTFTTGNYPASIAIGDINKDGKADIVTANRNPANATGTAYYVVSVLKNTSVSGTISFATKQDFTVDGQPSFVALGDINGDGVNDIITGNVGTNNVSVLINYSDNTGLFMGTLQSFTTGANSAVLGVADIDGDGKLDIVNTLTGKGLAVLRNTNTVNWSNSFTAPIILAKNINISDIVTGDIDGDGKVDIIGINTTTNDSLVVLRNTPILSKNNNLSSLIISTGTLVPTFDSLTTAYNVSVHNPIASLTVTPTKAQDSAKIEIQYNGGTYTSITSGVTSSSLSLNTGENTINLKVTAQNGNVKIYTIVVYRACLAPSSTTNLAVCPSQLPYQWNGLTFTTAGTKSTILTTSLGCDSTVTLNLSVKSTSSSLTNITICDSLNWNGTWYKQSGLYTYKTINSVGCDSSARVNLTIKKSTTSWTDVVTCDSTKWNGVWYKQSGFYTVHFTNKAGCDSAASLNLTVNDKPTGTFGSSSGDICAGDSALLSFYIPYTTNRQYLHIYSPIDTTFEIGTASFGADTRTTHISTNGITYLPNLSPNNQACSTTFATGLFAGKVVLIDRGTCTFTSKAKAVQDAGAVGIIIVNNVAGGGAPGLAGTDPTITIPVISVSQEDGLMIKNWINASQNVVAYSVVHTASLLWSTGSTAASIIAKPTQTTVYNVTASYENGCSQKFYYALLVRQNSTSTTTLSACDSLVWNGTTYKTSGQYVYHTLNSIGCDSAATLNLSIKKSTSSNVVTLCSSQFPYVWNGLTFTGAGSQTAHLINAAGCDSAATLYVVLNEYDVPNFTISSSKGLNLCSGDSTTLTVNGISNSKGRITFTIGATTYTDSITASSLGNPYLYSIFGANISATSATIVANDACNPLPAGSLNGRIALIRRGTCTFATKAINARNAGAIAVIIYNNVGGSAAYTPGGLDTAVTFPVFGMSQTDGEALLTQLNANNNIISSTVFAPKTYYTLTNGNADLSSPITLNTGKLTKDTTISITVYGQSGQSTGANNIGSFVTNNCGNTQSILIKVAQPSSSITNASICSGDSILFNGKYYKTTGIYTEHLMNAKGCDSAANLNLIVKSKSSSWTDILACDSAFYNGTTYKTSGQYIFHTTNAAGCDSTSVLNITIKKSTASTTNLSICPSTLPYTWNGLTFTTAGSKTKTGLTNSAGCDSSATLNLTLLTLPNAGVISGNSSFCFIGGSTTLTSNGDAGGVWTSSNSARVSVTSGGKVTASMGGNYIIYYTVTNACSTAVASFNIKVNVPSSTTISLSACDSYTWGGTTYTATGIYTKTGMTNVGGCDSTATLDLTIKKSTTSTTTQTACNTYTWGGTTYTTSGTYVKTGLKNKQNCDSTATLNLTIKPITSSTTNLSICSSALPYSWNGLTFTGAGSQTKTGLINSKGCDSSATLNLTVKAITSSTTNLSICPNALPYTWNGLTFTVAGSKTYHTLNSVGCDSAATLNLTVKTTTSSTTNLSICPSALPYSWNGLTFTAAGSQTKTGLVNSQGCDSSATLNLTIKSVTSSTVLLNICQTQLPYTVSGLTFSQEGKQSVILTNANGCDSVVTYILSSVQDGILGNAVITQPKCDSLFGSISAPYYDYIRVFRGSIDSTDQKQIGRLNITAQPTSSCPTSSINPGLLASDIKPRFYESYTLTNTTGAAACVSVNLKNYNPSNTYTIAAYNGSFNAANPSQNYLAHLGSSLGLGNAYFHFSVPANATFEIVVSDYFTGKFFGDYTLEVSGLEMPEFSINNGLNWQNSNSFSAVPIGNSNLIMRSKGTQCTTSYFNNPIAIKGKASTSSTTNQSVCPSALPYVWNGLTFTAAGSQTKTGLTNSQGCDSSATLNLTVKTNTSSTTNLSICPSQLPYSWNGLTFTATGSQTKTGLTNSQGCDSSATLNLTVKTNTSSTNNVSICPSQLPYSWNGLTFTVAGSQTKTGLINSQGCDSSATLNLTIKTNTSSNNNLAICPSQLPYSWNGLSFNTAGSQTKTGLINSQGCDSSATLNLTVKTNTSSTNNLSICPSQLPYSWNGLTFTVAGSQTKNGLTNSQGCDSSATLNLTVKTNTSSTSNLSICPSQLPYSWNGLTFTAAGSKTKTGLINSQGCDSSATLNLTVKTNTSSTSNLSICPSQLPYSWNSLTFTAAGSQTKTGLINSQGCDSSATLNLTVKTNTSSTTNLSICPSQLPYSWNGLTFTAAGSQTKTGLTNSQGCDSSATLNLTIKTNTSSTTNLSICPSALPYSWNGLTFTTAGSQTKTGLTNSQGCDSIATLNLTISNITYFTLNHTICSGQSYLGHSTNGVFNDTLTNSAGCDSVRTLNLTVTTSVTPTISIATASTNVCKGYVVVYNATVSNEGINPLYKWYKNGIAVGANSSVYKDSLLNNQDSIWCVLTSSETCVTANNIKSNVIKMNVSLAITGAIKTPTGNAISKVTLYRKGSVTDLQIVDGKYNSSCIDIANSVSLRPTKNNDVTKANGVTSVDVLLIQRHILNTSKLNSAYKLIAADVDGNKAINSVDILRMKRLILGTDTTFTSTTKGNRLWEFIDSAYTFPDTTNPFPFKDSISFTNLTSNKINQTFIGVKLGDVNYDWNATVAKAINSRDLELQYSIDNRKLATINNIIRIPITVNNFKDLVALQYTLHFDNKQYEFIGIENNKLGIDFNDRKANTTGNISMLWTDKNAVEKTFEDGTELFTLVLKGKWEASNIELELNNSITEIAAWNKDYNQNNIILNKSEIKNNQQDSKNEWLSLGPNPTNGLIRVNISSEINKTISFELTDAQGKLILKQSVELQKGNNNIALNLKQNGNISTGIYLLKAIGLENQSSKRIIVR